MHVIWVVEVYVSFVAHSLGPQINFQVSMHNTFVHTDACTHSLIPEQNTFHCLWIYISIEPFKVWLTHAGSNAIVKRAPHTNMSTITNYMLLFHCHSFCGPAINISAHTITHSCTLFAQALALAHTHTCTYRRKHRHSWLIFTNVHALPISSQSLHSFVRSFFILCPYTSQLVPEQLNIRTPHPIVRLSVCVSVGYVLLL